METSSGLVSDWEHWYGVDISQEYSNLRPIYPQEVYKHIIEQCNKTPGFGDSVAVDVGCGGGQSTIGLSPHFRKVVGVDPSPGQIKEACRNHGVGNVSFELSSAEDLSLFEDGSVDLVIAGTAMHWFQLDKFYSEVQRILKPVTGHFAFYHVHHGRPVNSEEGVQLFKKVAVDEMKLKELIIDVEFPGKDFIMEFDDGEGFKNFQLPFNVVNNFYSLDMYKDLSARTICRLFNTYSNFQALKNHEPANYAKVMENFEQRMREIFAANRTENEKEGPIISLQFPIRVKILKV